MSRIGDAPKTNASKPSAGRLVSMFGGAGGLDLGFEQEGFKIVWANEYDRHIYPTYLANRKSATMCTGSITEVDPRDLPREIDGVIGGPPCQSWSCSGAMRGGNDPRGKLFDHYLWVIKEVTPKFFVAENVPGLVSRKHAASYAGIKQKFESIGYTLTAKVVNAADYGVAQDRERVFIIGYRKDLDKCFEWPEPLAKRTTLRDAIGNLGDGVPAGPKNHSNPNAHNDHQYFVGSYSPRYLSRQRGRDWDELSYTVLAGGRYTPQHPSISMEFVSQDKWKFAGPDRRLSIRECARIQGFPDSYKFIYKTVNHAYQMVGNSVPPPLARVIAARIRADIASSSTGAATRKLGHRFIGFEMAPKSAAATESASVR